MALEIFAGLIASISLFELDVSMKIFPFSSWIVSSKPKTCAVLRLKYVL